jgi:hypothetical protein
VLTRIKQKDVDSSRNDHGSRAYDGTMVNGAPEIQHPQPRRASAAHSSILSRIAVDEHLDTDHMSSEFLEVPPVPPLYQHPASTTVASTSRPTRYRAVRKPILAAGISHAEGYSLIAPIEKPNSTMARGSLSPSVSLNYTPGQIGDRGDRNGTKSVSRWQGTPSTPLADNVGVIKLRDSARQSACLQRLGANEDLDQQTRSPSIFPDEAVVKGNCLLNLQPHYRSLLDSIATSTNAASWLTQAKGGGFMSSAPPNDTEVSNPHTYDLLPVHPIPTRYRSGQKLHSEIIACLHDYERMADDFAHMLVSTTVPLLHVEARSLTPQVRNHIKRLQHAFDIISSAVWRCSARFVEGWYLNKETRRVEMTQASRDDEVFDQEHEPLSRASPRCLNYDDVLTQWCNRNTPYHSRISCPRDEQDQINLEERKPSADSGYASGSGSQSISYLGPDADEEHLECGCGSLINTGNCTQAGSSNAKTEPGSWRTRAEVQSRLQMRRDTVQYWQSAGELEKPEEDDHHPLLRRHEHPRTAALKPALSGFALRKLHAALRDTNKELNATHKFIRHLVDAAMMRPRHINYSMPKTGLSFTPEQEAALATWREQAPQTEERVQIAIEVFSEQTRVISCVLDGLPVDPNIMWPCSPFDVKRKGREMGSPGLNSRVLTQRVNFPVPKAVMTGAVSELRTEPYFLGHGPGDIRGSGAEMDSLEGRPNKLQNIAS